MMTDPYAILGVSRTASADEIRRAYRKLAKALHPDARPDDKAAEEKFKDVTQAFKLLSDPEQRARFDQGEIDAQGQERPAYHFRSRPGGGPGDRGPSGRFEDLGDLFSDLFTDFGGARQRAQPMRGAEIKARLSVSFEEAMKGAKKRVSLPNGKSLEVGVPAGVESGKVLRLRGQGHPGRDGGPAGDALIEIVIAEHTSPVDKDTGAFIAAGLPYYEHTITFTAKVPYENEGWLNGQDLTKFDKDELGAVVKEKNLQIKKLYKEKDLEALVKL